MTIHYALFENSLTTDPDDYAAQVKTVGSVGLEEIADRIIDQGSTVTKPDILAVLEDSVKATGSLLLEGFRVNMGGLFEMFARIKGVFNGITDTFDPSRHYVDVGANPGSRIRNTVRDDAVIEKVETILPAPAPLEYVDLESGETNSTVTPGNIGTVNGHRLKYDDTQADEGIWFVAEVGGETKVTAVQKNKPGELVFLVPTLVNGYYTLEVRAQFSKDGEVRTGVLDSPLLVGPPE